MAATRRDRLTARLPMSWPTHPRVDRVQCGSNSAGCAAHHDSAAFGAMDRPAVAAGAVAAVAAQFAIDGLLRRTGAAGLADLVEPLPFLQESARRGVRAATFDGASTTTRNWAPDPAAAGGAARMNRSDRIVRRDRFRRFCTPTVPSRPAAGPDPMRACER